MVHMRRDGDSVVWQYVGRHTCGSAVGVGTGGQLSSVGSRLNDYATRRVSRRHLHSSSRPQTASPLLGDLKAVDEAMAMGGRLEALVVRGSQRAPSARAAKPYFATSPRRGCY